MEPNPAFPVTQMQPYTKFLFDYIFVQFSYVGALLTIQALDIFTGFIAACIRGKATSSASWKGILKKIATWCAILMVVILSREASTMFPVPIVRPVFWAFIASEGLSIVENLALCGVKMPEFVIRALYALREQRANLEKMKGLGGILSDKATEPTLIKEKETIYVVPSDPDKPQSVAIVNDPAHPVPVTSSDKEPAPYGAGEKTNE